MDVVSRCLLPVASRVFQDRPGSYALTFVCKATFSLAPGELVLAPEQLPIYEADCPWSEVVTSLYAASDVVPAKPRADVVLVGNAYAAGGVPVPSLVARLSVAEIDKAVEVSCDRTLQPDGKVISGPPFAEMPLLWERAAGGPGTLNPVGISQLRRDAYGAVALPNLTPPGMRAGFGEAPIPPVGFGPIAAGWPARQQRLGRAGEGWPAEDWHRRAPPAGLDMGFFNAAPLDQQPTTLTGKERVVLENLHPDHARLAMTLPGLRPRAMAENAAGSRPIPLHCDTLWIDTSRGLLTLLYRGRLPLVSSTEAGRVAITLDGGSAREAGGTWDGPDESTEVKTGPRTRRTLVDVGRSSSVLPFAPVAARPRDPRHPAGGPQAPAPAEPAAGASALPFRAPSPAARKESWKPPPTEAAPISPPLSPPIVASAPVIAAPAPVVVPSPVVPPMGAMSLGQQAAAEGSPPRPPRVTSGGGKDSPWATPGGPNASPGTAVPVTLGEAAVRPAVDLRNGGGALASSNAAAAAIAASSPAPAARPAEPVRAAAPAARPSQPEAPADVLDLVFFDTRSMPRVRRVPAWKPLLAELDDKPIEAGEDDPALSEDGASVEDRREILEILVRAEPAKPGDLDDALATAVRPDGRFVPPVVLLVGEIAFPFDEVETLRATVTTALPLVGTDENLRSSVELSKEFLRLPGLTSSPAVAEGLTTRVRDAFNGARRAVPANYLDTQTERVLLEQRAYQKRTVLGGKRLRALFTLAGGPAAAPAGGPSVAAASNAAAANAPQFVVYLPESVASELPMFARFRARLIARVHLPLDQYEQSPQAAEALALCRLVPPPRRAAPASPAAS
jgi:hypothetical protein